MIWNEVSISMSLSLFYEFEAFASGYVVFNPRVCTMKSDTCGRHDIKERTQINQSISVSSNHLSEETFV